MKFLRTATLTGCILLSLRLVTQATDDPDASPFHNTDVSESITTDGGDGYSSWSGEVSRTVVDMEIPGATAGHGLKWTRTYSSGSNLDGADNGWSHAYGWRVSKDDGKEPVIDFPDGRSGPIKPGSKDVFVDVAGPNQRIQSGEADLYLEDGSKVAFYRTAQSISNCQEADPSCTYEYFYRPLSVTDRYGNVTTLTTTEVDHNGLPFFYRLDKITDPSTGRWIALDYDTTNPYSNIPIRVRGSNGDSVSYIPNAAWPTTVNYSDGTSANYTYGSQTYDDKFTWYDPSSNPHTTYWSTAQVLVTAQDKRAVGPMQSIQYEYVQQGHFRGQISAEHYLSPTAAPGSAGGPVVSSFYLTSCKQLECGTSSYPVTQTETRGDTLPNGTKPTRDIHLKRQAGNVPLVMWTEDYKGVIEYFDYDGNNYLQQFTDRNGHWTKYTNTTVAGSPLTITHQGGIAYDGNPFPESTTTYTYTDNNKPFWITSIKDDRLNTTTYHRDGNNRVTSIDYPQDKNNGVAHEVFAYNEFGQVWKHQRRNGAFEYSQYDSTGLLIKRFNPTTTNVAQYSGLSSLSAPFTSYSYYTSSPWKDRVQTVTHPLNNKNTSCQQSAASETFEYGRDASGNPCFGRGLVTKITHVDGTYQQFRYDVYGNKIWERNENGEETNYKYDDYKRLNKVTDPLNHFTTFSYDPNTGDVSNPAAAAYQHTTSSVWFATDPAGVVTHNSYDENFRKTSSKVANNNPTTFHYDAVGNEDYVIDPRGNGSENAGYTTYSDYDSRNRKWRIRAPLGFTTSYGFDANGNVTAIQHPDGNSESKTYDNLNRVITHVEPVAAPNVTKTTLFDYWPAGTLHTVTDPNGHITTFGYNEADLKTIMVYPDNATSRGWTYDDMYNLMQRRTANNEIQYFCYDNRNRRVYMEWSNKGSNPAANAETAGFGYDNVGRLKTANNGNSSVTRTYDLAGRLKTDQQAVAGGQNVTVQYGYDGASGATTDDGRLTGVNIGGTFDSNTGFFSGGSYDMRYRYDALGRVQYIGDQWDRLKNGTGNYIQYTYDAASNVSQRDNLLSSKQSIVTPHDELNRMSRRYAMWNNGSFSIETYRYDSMSRLQFEDRAEDGKEDRFVYDYSSQLTSASYGQPISSPTPTPAPSASPSPTAPPDPTCGGKPCHGVVTPIINPVGGYPLPMQVYMNSVYVGATIFYTASPTDFIIPTHDGPLPTGETAVYAGPISVEQGSNVFFMALVYLPDTGDSEIVPFQANNVVSTDPTNGPTGAVTVTAPTIAHTTSYQLDMAGNRKTVTDNNVPTAYTQNTSDGTLYLNEYSAVGGNAVSNGGEHQIGGFQNVFYTYINDGRLSQAGVKDSAGNVTGGYNLAYDALGRCVKRSSGHGTTFYYYDGEKPISEQSTTSTDVYGGTTAASNIYGLGIDEIVVRFETSNVYYFFQDHEGSITHVRNTSGPVEQYRYDAFGQPTIRNGTATTTYTSSQIYNRFMFTGREWAAANLGFYEYRARAYNPVLGRFMSEDPKGFDAGDYNLFRYCDNDPEDMTDPMGLAWDAPNPSGADKQAPPRDTDGWLLREIRLAQWIQQRQQEGVTITSGGPLSMSYFAGLARYVDVTRAAAGEGSKDSAGVEFVVTQPIETQKTPEEITQCSTCTAGTRAYTERIVGKPRTYTWPLTGKISVTIPTTARSVLPTTTRAYDDAEKGRRTDFVSASVRADTAAKGELARLGGFPTRDPQAAAKLVRAWADPALHDAGNFIETEVLGR